ncbi:MAG TPA: DUF6485 family protein [Candidatus Omnitrophota bacterium]|nr:DUF6485 family protein [Candidatus Omnitrophota bacterium]HPS36449.1 DUF6485 family protein [Candidatus Omnitrophota bacterium]
MECKNSVNRKRCNCSYEPCSRKGVCCDCLAYHRDQGEVPACFFPDHVEKTYDRSLGNFLRTCKER